MVFHGSGDYKILNLYNMEIFTPWKKVFVIKKALILLVLTYVSGGFTLERIGLSSGFQVRYVMLAATMFLILMSEIRKEKTKTYRNDTTNFYLLSTYAYFIILMITAVYTADIPLFFDKMIDVVFLFGLLITTTYMFRFFTFDEIIGVITTVLIVVGLIYVIPIFQSVLSGSLRGTNSIGGPNVVTRVLFFSAASAWYKFHASKKLQMLLLCFAFLAGVVLVGSRGGILGAFGASLVFLSFRGLYRPKKKHIRLSLKKLLYYLIPAAAIFYMWDYLERVFINRIVNLLINQVYYAGRDLLYVYAEDLIRERPFLGYGLNGYTIATGEVYPHNTLLEMMVETGVVGAVYFAITCIITLLILKRYRKSDNLIIAILPFYMQIVQMFSGDLYDFRYFFLFSVICLYYMQPLEKKVKNKVTNPHII